MGLAMSKEEEAGLAGWGPALVRCCAWGLSRHALQGRKLAFKEDLLHEIKSEDWEDCP